MRTIASVYQQTPLGSRAAQGAGEHLDTGLTGVLQAIDGKRSSRLLVMRFAFLGDVSALLIELENKRLIVQADPAQLAPAQQQPEFADTHAGSYPAELHESQFPQTSSMRLHESQFPQTTSMGLHESQFPQTSSMDLHESQFPQTTAQGLYANDSLDVSPAKALQNVRTREVCDFLSDFIIKHLPALAFEELADLERIETVGHLMAYLSHYQELVQHAGAAGSRHLADLDMRIEELLSTL